jgi:translocation and assembly module TamB
MTRRRFIALVSLCVLLTLGLIGICVGLVATRSDSGQAVLRRWIEARVASSIHGKVYIGRMSGNFLTGVTIDSLEMRDDEDSLFVATGPVTLQYDPRDLVDRRLYFRRVDVQRPVVVLRQHENWTWNFKRMFGVGGPSKPKGPERGFGDFVQLDSTHIHGGSFRLTIPWHPDDSLHGARRDSAVRANIARDDHEISRTREGLTQTYRWTKIYAAVPYARLADPDSIGKAFRIDTIHSVETVPTFTWRNVAGVVRVLGDSVWVKSPHWDLPGSTGRAEGKIVWGSDLPVRYAIRIWGDSVSLADVAWVYPTLPRTGGGRMVLDIKNERDLHQLDYAIHEMDVRTTKSRLKGAMTFETGGRVLAVHDVKLEAAPVDFDLLRTLNGKPFPADWQGTLTGTVTARGGPLNHFFVDASELTFRDAHVPGAVSRVKGRGELDILLPAFTAFHRFNASTDRLDLRTLVAIYPAFPRVTGIVSGSAVLDSSWLDVRFSNANLTHTDGPGEPTRAAGSGRVTYGEQFMTYDLALQASPLSLTTLARSYPKLPLRGLLTGPIRVRGTAPELDVQADLTGPAGRLIYAGKVDADSVGGYGARGRGTFDALDAASLVGRATPPSRLAGSYDVDLVGDSLATLAGSLGLRLDRSDVDGLRIAGGAARARFDRGAVYFDTLHLTGAPGSLRATGALGLTRPVGRDSLVLALDVDSLGGLRRYLTKVTSNEVLASADSLGGALAFRGTVHGWLDSLDVRGALTGSNLRVRTSRARVLQGNLALHSVRGHTTGALDVRADTIVAAGVHVASTTLRADVLDRGHAIFSAGARGNNGTSLRATGDWRSLAGTTTVQLDTFDLALAEGRWGLRRPMRLASSATGMVVDTLLLADDAGARIAGFLNVPAAAPARIHLRADSLRLADLGVLAQLPSALDGRLGLDFDVTGTREQPVMTLVAEARGLRYGALSTESVALSGGYEGSHASVQANLLRGGRSILDATLQYPVALTLFSARETGDSLRGRVHADSVDLALVEALSSKFRNTTGRLALDLAISGHPARPHVGGRATVRDGAIEIPTVGLRFAGIDGQVEVDPARDSLTIAHLRWSSPASKGTGSLQGSVVFGDRSNPRLDLRLDTHGLRAVDKRGLARLDVSTGASGLTLTGTPAEATLSGAVNVDRGTIYIPELVRKQIVDLTPDDFAQLFDTTDVRNRSLMPQPPGALVEHLRLDGVSVNVGDEVWLRSREASIKLGGSLNVTRARDDRESGRSTLARDLRGDSARYKLALSGTLSADRGTYTLDLTAVQREFQVESGRITFFGTPDFNPEIDVTAVYRVKQQNRSDIGVKARIHGNFYPQPALELSSSDAYLSPSDLVSYLVTGRPSFELSDQNVPAAQRAYEFVLPTAGALVSRALREQLGGVVDLFQIQSGAVNDPLSTTENSPGQFRSFLQSTRLGGEKRISDKLFLSFSTGLCFTEADAGSQDRLSGFMNAIEGKFEYRFPLVAPDRLSLRAGLDPAASALRCGKGVRGFVPTPQQWGFSLFRSWVF